MISRIHSKLGTAGLVVAIVALVVALTGVAFAATGLNGKQKKEVKKIAKQFAGQDGAPGAVGPAGPQGVKGDTGPEGKQGAPGQAGKNGEDGEDGACSEANPVCTLPAGATETGVWALGTDDGPSIVPITFNLPLAQPSTAIHYVNKAGEERTAFEEAWHATPENCMGSEDEPTAPEGEICIYADEENNGALPGYLGAHPLFSKLFTSGATFFYSIGEGWAWGTWAVTGS
jgi:hypothetical protein